MKKYIFLSFVAMLVFGCNTNPGITLEDLEHHDSMMLVKFDSLIDLKLESAGMWVADVDSTSFVLGRAEASAVFERTFDLYHKLAGLEMSSTANGLEFPKGAFDHHYFTTSNGDRYRMILQVDEDRGLVWVHFDQSQPNNECVLFGMGITFSVDASSGKAQAFYGHGYVGAYNTCLKTEDEKLAAEYLDDISRQAVCAPNWMLSEFENMLEKERLLES